MKSNKGLLKKIITKFFFIEIFVLLISFSFSLMLNGPVNNLIYSLTLEANEHNDGAFVVQLHDEKIAQYEEGDYNNIIEFNRKKYSRSNLISIVEDEYETKNGLSITLTGADSYGVEKQFSTSWIQTLTTEGFTNFESNSVIVTKSYADSLLGYVPTSNEDYSTLIGREVSLKNSNNNLEHSLSISGVYRENADWLPNNYLNDSYKDFGDTFIVHYDFFGTLANFNHYGVFRSANYQENQLNLSEQFELLDHHTDLNIKLIENSYNDGFDVDFSLYEQKEFSNNYFKTNMIVFSVISSLTVVIVFITLILVIYNNIFGKDKLSFKKSNIIDMLIVVFAGLITAAALRNSVININGYAIMTLNAAGLQALVISMLIIYLIILLFNYNYEKVLFKKDLAMETHNTNKAMIISQNENLVEEYKPIESETKNMKKLVVVFANIPFPDGSGSAIRCSNFIKLFTANGYQAIASGVSTDINDINKEIEKDYILYPFAIERSSSLIQKGMKHIKQTKRIENRLGDIEKKYGKPDVIFAYSTLNKSTINYLNEYCKKHSIRLILDVVEAHNASQMSLSSFFTIFLGNNYIFRNANKKLDAGIISISRYLDEHFETNNTKNNPRIYIPFINDNENSEFVIHNKIFKKDDRVVFLYAGMAGKKDLLVKMIRAFNELDENLKEQVLFVIAGNSVKQIKALGLTEHEYIESLTHTVYLGKVSQKVVDDLYKQSDFSVLLRPEKKRYAKAGFPTKTAESWAHGVPAIANMTSDLHGYLIDGYNGYIVEQSTVASLKTTIEKALTNRKDYKQMRINSRNTSLEKLDMWKYEEKFIDFVNSIPIKKEE